MNGSNLAAGQVARLVKTSTYIPSYFHLIPAPKVLDKNWTSFIDNILGSSINNVSSEGDGGGVGSKISEFT